MERDQATQDNNINLFDDNNFSENSLDNQDSDGSDSDDKRDNYLDNSPAEDSPGTQQLPCMLRALGFKGSNAETNRS